MGKKSNKRKRKEEIAEDCCFICKDGGNMRVCDFGDCLKAYHPECVDKDNTFLKNDSNWCCGSHYCYICRKASKFMCFCCPAAVCGKCFFDGEFATVKRNKGFCRHCAKLASLLEKKADVDSDGEKIDFEDQETYECYFQEYYKFIKKKEGLNSQNAHFAHDFIKNGKNKRDLDPYEIGEEEDDSGESDVSDFQASDCDDLNDTSGVKLVRRKKKCMKKLKSIKGKVGDKKKDFVGWGSRSLIDFLEDIGRDTAKELSEHDVASIIIEYCNSNKLFDPEKKRKVICDEKLRTLLRRKSVNKNNIQNLLTSHFVENLEETDDIICGSEDRDYNEPMKFSRSRNLNPTTKSCQSLVSKELPNGFAAIISSNLKLVYLKRSLIEELLKKPETFDGKVLGSFVRTKSDPNDYLQKNSHLLLPVIGINRSSKNEEINQEIMLRLLNVPKDVPICKISDDDFSEEECQDLYQRMRNGLLKQPTILELEQKARTLHEDIIKHWISRELALLRNRIDLANEKGWRRELAQYMDRKLKLESPSEQSRLLSEIPKVIPEMVYTNLSPEDSSREDKLEQNDLPELVTGDTCNSKDGGFAQCMDKRTDVIGPKTPVKNNHDDTTLPTSVEQLSVYGASQDKGTSRNELIQYTSKRRDDHLSVADPVKATVNDVVVADPVKATINDVVEADPVKAVVSYVVEATVNDVIVLSDSDEEDVNIKNTPAGQKGVENPDVSFWNCSGVYYDETRGPFSMSVLKSWSDSASSPLEFKVWKTGESERKAIPLRDALRLFFP